MQRTTIILACFCLCTDIAAQSTGSGGQYSFVHYTPKDGLVNSRVRKAYQDSKGRMYFMTYGGLSVYDGARFRNYSKSNGLVNNMVNDVLEIGNDSILVATNTGTNVNLLENGKMGLLKMKNTTPVINQFYRHTNNKIYLATDNGLFLLEKEQFHELNIFPLIEKSYSTPYLDVLTGIGNWLVFSVVETKYLRGLYLYDIAKDKLCDSIGLNMTLFNKDKNERIWISTINKLMVLDHSALVKGKLILADPPAALAISTNVSIANMNFTKETGWYIFRDSLYRSVEVRNIAETVPEVRLPLPPEIASSIVKHIFVDRENTVWLSNDGEGVFKLVQSPLQSLELSASGAKDHSISHVYPTGQTTWFSTYVRTLIRKTGSNTQEFKTNITGIHIIHDNGKRLLGNDFNTIYEGRVNTEQKTIIFKPIFSTPNDLFGRSLLVDRHDNIITIQEKGLGVWKQNKLISYFPSRSKENISDQIAFDKQGRLWCITRYRGIDVFSLHPENEQQYLRTELYFHQEMIIGSPRTFVFDKNGWIWIGTREDGLVAYVENGNQLVKKLHFHPGNGLTDIFVTALACDSLNNIIVGTQTGIDRLVPTGAGTYKIENLSRSKDHFAFIKETWTTGSHGYALTLSGQLIQISPAGIPGRTTPPSLLLEELKVNSKLTPSGKNEFSHNQNNITFLVAAPSFIDEKQVTYSYLLEGSGNKQWSDTAAANAAVNLTNLSAGSYVLKIKAFFPSSSYPPAVFSYPFEITPPWWQTWWFRAAAGISVLALVILAIRFYYRRKLEKEKTILENQQAIERERTRIATDMHDDLGAGLSRIKFLSQSISNKNLEDATIKTELEKITGYSNEMTEKMGEIVWALNEKNDTLADLVAYTRSYTVEYLANHDIACVADTPLHLPGTFITGEIRRNIFLSVKESLHNIVKHSGATRVNFTIQLDKSIRIIIHDNGKGIDWDHQRPFSNGIQNIRQRMKEIKGQAAFSNDNGTKLVITIPLFL